MLHGHHFLTQPNGHRADEGGAQHKQESAPTKPSLSICRLAWNNVIKCLGWKGTSGNKSEGGRLAEEGHSKKFGSQVMMKVESLSNDLFIGCMSLLITFSLGFNTGSVGYCDTLGTREKCHYIQL